MDEVQLKPFAQRYIWWLSVEEALQRPDRVIAQVMDIGTFDDSRTLIEKMWEARLCEVLAQAEAGWFRPKSWHYWHYLLGMANVGEVPEMPNRRDALKNAGG